eukprot:TRINITY_DN8774_c0_g1_i1.p1 TRINITY_DN8774_c0_g1~~TRINITY_DN8774_c0_g1_i1.p1  ORF type:complete len:419 (+),score=77.75 TRINITY_DN8774_c0_g1_i1:56-1312(+)
MAVRLSYHRPSASKALAAVGLEQLVEVLRPCFIPDEHFDPVPLPGPDDWLANFREPFQTVAAFTIKDAIHPKKGRSKIYLAPLGTFDSAHSPSLEALRSFACAYLCMEVEMLPAIDLDISPNKKCMQANSNGKSSKITIRTNQETQRIQMKTPDIFHFLQKLLPPDGAAILGITMEDLYHRDEWNFVFGEAQVEHHIGVFSFARYHPSLPNQNQDPLSDVDARILLRRSGQVLVHECIHLFGVAHCKYFHCCMNGANNLEESDLQPIHLCPIDLHKLYHIVPFDPVVRYRQLFEWYTHHGLENESSWVQSRLSRLDHENQWKPMTFPTRSSDEKVVDGKSEVNESDDGNLRISFAKKSDPGRKKAIVVSQQLPMADFLKLIKNKLGMKSIPIMLDSNGIEMEISSLNQLKRDQTLLFK